MAFVYKKDVVKGGDGNTVTTVADNFGGCDVICVIVASLGGSNNTPTDSVGGNTYVARTRETAFGSRNIALWYAINPSTSGTMTFTQTESGTKPVIAVIGFSGVDTSTPYDGNENTNGAADITTLASGSVTPSQANCLVITATFMEDNGGGVTTATADSPYSHGTNLPPVIFGNPGIRVAYNIQTSATATNPSWTYDASCHVGLTDITVFRSGGAAPAGRLPSPTFIRQAVNRASTY